MAKLACDRPADGGKGSDQAAKIGKLEVGELVIRWITRPND